MKKWNIWSGSLLTVLGLLVIIFPKFWSRVIVISLGIGAIVYGIYNLKITKALSNNSNYNKTILIRGIASIVIGVVVIVCPFFMESLWKVMVWVLIIYLIISSCLGFYSAALLKDTGIDRKKYVFENIGLLVLAIVLILITPENLRNMLLIIAGIIAMVVGVVIIVFAVISIVKGNSDVVATVEAKDADVRDDEPAAEKTEDTADAEKEEPAEVKEESAKEDAEPEEEPAKEKAEEPAKKEAKPKRKPRAKKDSDK